MKTTSGKKHPEDESQADQSRKSKVPEIQGSGNSQGHMVTKQQTRCTICGQTFSEQTELNAHYKAVHHVDAPAPQSLSEAESYWRQETDYHGDLDAHKIGEGEKVPERSRISAEGALSGRTSKDDEMIRVMTGGGSGKSQYVGRSEFTCQRCGQVCVSQIELDKHIKNKHGMESGKIS